MPDYETVEGVVYDKFMPETENSNRTAVISLMIAFIVILAIGIILTLAIVRVRQQKMAEIRRVTETEDHK